MKSTHREAGRPPALRHTEAAVLAAEENQRVVGLAHSLEPADWSQRTDCPAWDVRALLGHVLGMMEFSSSFREFVHVARAGRKAAAGRPVIDGMTEVQVADRAGLSRQELLDRLTAAAPRAARARRRLPAPLRAIPMKQETAGTTEFWRLGYLFDVILTRDPWMHRVDICRATGREPVLTADHDGRLVADVVAEWARRHGRPFHLTLTGPAGGVFSVADGAGPDRGDHRGRRRVLPHPLRALCRKRAAQSTRAVLSFIVELFEPIKERSWKHTASGGTSAF